MTMEQSVEQFMGLPFDVCIRQIGHKIERHVSKEELTQYQKQYKHNSFELMQEKLRAVPSVEDILKQLSIPIAVASSSSYEELTHILGKGMS